MFDIYITIFQNTANHIDLCMDSNNPTSMYSCSFILILAFTNTFFNQWLYLLTLISVVLLSFKKYKYFY